ncbi:l-fucose:H+ symporter permease [Prevotella sp. CAG:5226]|uniref:sugar MFS transporter n=1 Tax=Prevotellamassilia timonensis TaxID=1852370 RepID=UPI00033A4562|nr:sugar MFS transporter [uncultured Prevotellamassilia sp.]CDA44072.1 l-fucose:H+ symporter permease [Prevotella sp. CAG:5226]
MANTKPGLFRTADGKNYLWPFVLVTSLFFLWGLAHSILDVLNKHFQETMDGVGKTESALVQAVMYGGYFVMALPAGQIIKRYGYRAGVITGLLLYGIGALLFIPGGQLLSFPFFLFSLFVIGCGLTCLETSANPYVTVLGNAEGAARRINLSQSFNGLGWIVGPLIGGHFAFAVGADKGSIAIPYAIIGVVVLCVALVFAQVKLPEVQADGVAQTESAHATDSLWQHRNFVYGLIALFLYVAAQTGINSFFINYVTEHASVSNVNASLLLGFGGMGLFMVGRMGGSWLMLRVRAERVLLYCAVGATLAMAVLLSGAGVAGVAAFMLCYLCESIMFPTIFALALKGVGQYTKRASSFLIMSIVGGAIAPVLMGLIADHASMAMAFIVPLCCFVVIAAYAARFARKA